MVELHLGDVTRLSIIDHRPGAVPTHFEAWNVHIDVHLEDEMHTLKVWVTSREEDHGPKDTGESVLA